MSYLPEPKDPAEVVTVTFDFSGRTDTPSNPAVSIGVRWGAETVPTLVTVGTPTVTGAQVTQQVSGGANLNDYNLKCLADTPDGDKLAVDWVLAVRTRPI